jgi:hypothetical protein
VSPDGVDVDVVVVVVVVVDLDGDGDGNVEVVATFDAALRFSFVSFAKTRCKPGRWVALQTGHMGGTC